MVNGNHLYYSLLYLHVIVERKIKKKFIFLTLCYEYVHSSRTNDAMMCVIQFGKSLKLNLLK